MVLSAAGRNLKFCSVHELVNKIVWGKYQLCLFRSVLNTLTRHRPDRDHNYKGLTWGLKVWLNLRTEKKKLRQQELRWYVFEGRRKRKKLIGHELWGCSASCGLSGTDRSVSPRGVCHHQPRGTSGPGPVALKLLSALPPSLICWG